MHDPLRRGIGWLAERLGMEPEAALDSLLSMAMKGGYTLLAFLTTVLLARLLGAAAYGVYSYAYSLVWLVAMPLQAGLPGLVVRETARALAIGRPDLVRGLWLWSGRVVGVVSLGLIAVVGPVLVLWHGGTGPADRATFAWGLVLVPLVALGNMRGAALRGLKRVLAGQLPEQLVRPALFALLLGSAGLLSSRGLSAAQAMALQVAASFITFLIGAFLLWKNTPASVRLAAAPLETRPWLMSSLLFALITGFQMVNRQVSTVILGLFAPAAEVGIYRAAVQVSMVAGFGLEAVNVVVSPRFSDLFAQRNFVGLQRLATAGARAALAFNLAVTGAFLTLGRRFFALVLGSEFAASYTPLMILLVGQLVNSAAGSVATLLNMTGHERETARGMAVAALMNIVLNLALVPMWGTGGAASATAVSMIVWNLILWRTTRKALGLDSSAFPVTRRISHQQHEGGINR